jgi:hypothetical protein
MVGDARRRAPHREDLILRSPLSRQRTCAVQSGFSKDEANEVKNARGACENASSAPRLKPFALPRDPLQYAAKSDLPSEM